MNILKKDGQAKYLLDTEGNFYLTDSVEHNQGISNEEFTLAKFGTSLAKIYALGWARIQNIPPIYIWINPKKPFTKKQRAAVLSLVIEDGQRIPCEKYVWELDTTSDIQELSFEEIVEKIKNH